MPKQSREATAPTPPTNEPPEWTIGDRCRKARRAAGIEARELAVTLGVSPNTISNYENDRFDPKKARRTLISWALATGVPLAWLETGATDTPQEEQPPRGRARRQAVAGKLPRPGNSGWSDMPTLNPWGRYPSRAA
jgi:transcriptional regulator with XRE-family HTH domain